MELTCWAKAGRTQLEKCLTQGTFLPPGSDPTSEHRFSAI